MLKTKPVPSRLACLSVGVESVPPVLICVRGVHKLELNIQYTRLTYGTNAPISDLTHQLMAPLHTSTYITQLPGHSTDDPGSGSTGSPNAICTLPPRPFVPASPAAFSMPTEMGAHTGADIT